MKKILWNEGWTFSLDGGVSEAVTLPHDFSICLNRRENARSGADGGYFPGGVGEYVKTFTVKKGKRRFLLFDGSFGITEVFLNEHLLKINRYGYNDFLVELTDVLYYDRENCLKVRVNNMNQPNARWYTGSGLYRDVFLCECGKVRLDPYAPFVYTRSIREGDAFLTGEIIFESPEESEGKIEITVFEDGKNTPAGTFTRYIYAFAGENRIKTDFTIRNAKLWSPDEANLYRAEVRLTLDCGTDVSESVFGVRTIALDPEKGLFISGKKTVLRGGCVHHDHGMLGSAAYADAEYRRVAKLKKAGYNAVRCSHNPQSSHFYEACDRLGMLVIDEYFDYWTEGKRTDDFHTYFELIWEELVTRITLRDRNHPSVIMWSTGNEIPQKGGHGKGYEIARKVSALSRSLDPSRPLTHALCSFWDKAEYQRKANETNNYGSERSDFWADKTKITADTVDIVGYNYLEDRIEKDLIRFPDRLIVCTESFPISSYKTTKQVDRTPRFIGDFVWTAWDYFGETGIGHVDYEEEKPGLLTYPEHVSNCGDFDICGRRRPQSYYREIAWGGRSDPYIIVRDPEVSGKPYHISPWGFYDGKPKWNFPGSEGKNVEVNIFAECDELRVSVNGTEKKRFLRTDNGVYNCLIAYEKGDITAQAYTEGKKTGSFTLTTEGKAVKLSVVPEKRACPKKALSSNEVVYFDVSLRDENGNVCTTAGNEVTYTVTGGKILGIGSAEYDSTENYAQNHRKLYRGVSTVAVLRQSGGIVLTAEAGEFRGEAKA